MFAMMLRRFTTMGYAVILGYAVIQRSLRLTLSDLETDDVQGRYLRWLWWYIVCTINITVECW